MALELLFGDVHDDFVVYGAVGSRLEALAKEGRKTARVYCLGDFSEQINQQIIVKQAEQLDKNPEVVALLTQVGAANNLLEQYSARDPSTFTDKDKDVIGAAQDIIGRVQSLKDSMFAKEAEMHYGEHEKRLAALKKTHGVEIYGVAGNHDNGFIYDTLQSVTFLENGQPLLKEGIAGAIHSTETSEAFAGPGLRYAVPTDDHEDPAQSPLYQGLKDANVNLVVAHKESNPPGDEMNSGNGLFKLVQEKKAIQYAGHMHSAYVRRDPTTGTLILCPGRNYIMVCDREGNHVKKIDIYRIPAAGRVKIKNYGVAA